MVNFSVKNTSSLKMVSYYEKFKKQLLQWSRFSITSIFATAVDLAVYSLFIFSVFSNSQQKVQSKELLIATIIGTLSGMLVNFYLQKKYVFTLNRKLSRAFSLSILVTFGAIILETSIVYFLSQSRLFQYGLSLMIPKIAAMICVFFYSYYLMKIVFERKL